MPTRNLVLTDHQAAFIESLVHSGRYQNASEVLREGIRLMERQELEGAARLEALRAAAQTGAADVAAGRYGEFGEADSLRERLAQLTDQALAEGGGSD